MLAFVNNNRIHAPSVAAQAVRWPGLAFRRLRVRASLAAASLAICSPHLHRAIRGAQGVLHCVGWGAPARQLDLPSVTPLSLAGCGRL